VREYTAIVEGGAEPVPGARLLLLDCPPLSASSRPGQFIMVRCGEGHDPYLRHPLPIHRLRPEGIALYFRPVGPALAWLGARRIGESVNLLGPCGRGFDIPPSPTSLSLVCQGMGIGVLAAILDRTRCGVQLIAEVPTPAQVYPRELLPRAVEYLPFAGHDQAKALWQAVEQSCHWSERLYAAGPLGFYRRLQQTIATARLGLRPGLAQAWVEGDMACGRGICQSCLMTTRQGARQLCLDGPAFDLADLVLD
jgi:dihydroorotate dehydrogenase electron transfer subunit